MRKRPRYETLPPGERLGIEQLRAAAAAGGSSDVDRLLLPRLLRAGIEIGWLAKVVNLARARRSEAKSNFERDRRAALQALRRGTQKFLGWHHRYVHPHFGSSLYPVVKALDANLSKSDVLTIPKPTVWTPRRRRGPKDVGWSEAERSLKEHGVSRETQRMIRRLFDL